MYWKWKWFLQLNKQPKRLKNKLENSRFDPASNTDLCDDRAQRSIRETESNFHVFICSSKYESFQVIFTNGSLVPSRPRRFRMWRHLSSLSGKFACSGNSDSANWPGYKAAPMGTVRIRSWPDVKFCAHAQCVLSRCCKESGFDFLNLQVLFQPLRLGRGSFPPPFLSDAAVQNTTHFLYFHSY